MQFDQSTYEERKFSRMFVRSVRRYYKRKLLAKLYPFHIVRLGHFKAILRELTHSILTEERMQSQRPSKLLAMSKEHFEMAAEHIVDVAIAPKHNRFANSRHPNSGELEYRFAHYKHHFFAVIIQFISKLGFHKFVSRCADYITYVPAVDKISIEKLRINLEQEFDSILDANKVSFDEYEADKQKQIAKI